MKTLGYSLEKPSPRIDACVDYESRTKCLESVNALLGLVWNDFIVRSTFNCGNFSLALCALSYCRFIEGICVLPICSCVLCSVMCTKWSYYPELFSISIFSGDEFSIFFYFEVWSVNCGWLWIFIRRPRSLLKSAIDVIFFVRMSAICSFELMYAR